MQMPWEGVNPGTEDKSGQAEKQGTRCQQAWECRDNGHWWHKKDEGSWKPFQIMPLSSRVKFTTILQLAPVTPSPKLDPRLYQLFFITLPLSPNTHQKN